MPEDQAIKRAQRLSRISYLLYRNPQGLTVQELSELCGVSPRTIQRDLRDLDELSIPLWDDGSSPPRYGIIEGYYLPPVRLELDDAVALYLAARLLARYADSYDPHIVHALAKLSTVLPGAIAEHVQTTAASLMDRPHDGQQTAILSTLALGWAAHRQVCIWHRSGTGERQHRYTVCPYFIEASAVGNATYLIGHASYFERVTTFKVERISRAELLDESFEIPRDFDPHRLLASAWSIMYGDDLQEVVLRFLPERTRRVKESRWHPSQQIEDLDDGGCIMRLWVAEPVEMTYWILGWGGQVEVLEPAELRDSIGQEARTMAALYACKTDPAASD